MSGEPFVGGDILRLITAGMYDNPLVLFREYLQNAADSIASTDERSGSVQIEIDPVAAHVTITDDGPGLSHDEAVSRLIPIGNSAKDPELDRGLRGIGRLSSLAFAEEVHFTTRTAGSEPVTRVSWNARTLREPGLEHLDATTAIEEATCVQNLPGDGWPDHFFQVSVERVNRHATSTLLNRDAVHSYIAEVCPVSFSPAFPLADEVTSFLSDHTDHFVFNVSVNPNGSPIARPFGKSLPLSDTYAAPFERLETRVIPRIDEGQRQPAAVLWLAHTPYAGSIPRHLGVRGLRARSGNIQIGSDDVFRHLFQETRFNGWCVGEVHITDYRITPNGRRDYFEPGPHLRNLENHIGAIAHEISTRCRRASSHRNKLRQAELTLRQSEAAQSLAQSGYLLPEDATALVEKSRAQMSHIQSTLHELNITPPAASIERDLLFQENHLEITARQRPVEFDSLSPEVVCVLQSAFGNLANSLPARSAVDLIQSILDRVAKRHNHDPKTSP